MSNIKFEDHIIEQLKQDPSYCIGLITEALSDDDPRTVFTILKYIALSKDISEADLAKQMGVTRMTVNRILKGSNPTWVNAMLLLEALGIKVTVELKKQYQQAKPASAKLKKTS